jgi:hypothetical protein
VPNPTDAGDRYAEAIRQKDARALYEMLDEESRRALGPEQVERLLRDSAPELERRARLLAGPEREVSAQAALRFSDGEVVTLKLEEGGFRLSSASAFPSGASTPAQALHELRAALARQSYPALLQVLSDETRGEIERQVLELIRGLEHPEALDIVVDGDSATVTTAAGHRVELVNEGGVWKVRDFE